MLFYLTSEKYQDRLDFLKEDYVLNIDIKSEITQETFLQYIKKEIRNIQIDYFLIDMSIFESDEINLQECVDSFFLLNPESRIILFPVLVEDTGELFGAIEPHDGLLVIHNLESPELEVINILNSKVSSSEQEENKTDLEGVSKEMSDITEETISINPENIFQKAVTPVKTSDGQPLPKRNETQTVKSDKEKIVVEEEKQKKPNIMKLEDYMKQKSSITGKWQCENIMIGIIGTEKNTGTTTVAFQLTAYLQSIGARVSYVEANGHNHLGVIAEHYSFVKIDDHYVKGTIAYYMDSNYDTNAGMNFIIFDLGSFAENEERNKKLAETMDQVLFVSGGRPYELEALDSAIDKIKDKKINIIFNMAVKKDLISFKQRYKSEAKCITYTKYCQDILVSEIDAEEIIALFDGYHL